MDKEKVEKGIMHILLKHTKEEYVGATGYIKFHEEDFLLFAKELAERIEIDRDNLCEIILGFPKYSVEKDGQLYRKIIKACPIKIKEDSDDGK